MELIASYQIDLVCFCLILSVIMIKLITIDNSVVSTNFTNWINCQITTWAKSFSIFSFSPQPVPPPSPAHHGSDSIQLALTFLVFNRRTVVTASTIPQTAQWRGQSCFGRWHRKSQSPRRDLRAWNCSRCWGGKKCWVWQTSMRWLKMWGGKSGALLSSDYCSMENNAPH